MVCVCVNVFSNILDISGNYQTFDVSEIDVFSYLPLLGIHIISPY